MPTKHTRAQPTDAYGTIEFQGGAHPTKAQVSKYQKDLDFESSLSSTWRTSSINQSLIFLESC